MAKRQQAEDGGKVGRKVCQKIPHSASGGYMHDEEHDGPYDVDGVLYCGRCHSWYNNPADHGAPAPVACKLCGKATAYGGGDWCYYCSAGKEAHPAPVAEPAADEEIATWVKRPCLDTQCRCIELHMDKAIARIESDRATIAKQAQEIERLEKHNRQLDAEGSALAMELARVKSMTVHEFRKRIAEPGGKVEAIWDNTTICFGNDCPNCERERKNKLAPEPKPGSEELIPEEALHIAAQCWCDPETSDRVMDPPLATAFARRLVPYLALRAELAAAREETIRSNGLVAIERASRERAEARVRGLEEKIVHELCNYGGACITVCTAPAICSEARAILAKSKEISNE